MMNRKATTKGGTDKELQSGASLLFKALNDATIPQNIRYDLQNHVGDVLSVSELIPDITQNRKQFITCFVDGMKRANKTPFSYSRDNAQEIINRLQAGESVEAIINDFNRKFVERTAELKRERAKQCIKEHAGGGTDKAIKEIRAALKIATTANRESIDPLISAIDANTFKDIARSLRRALRCLKSKERGAR